MTTGDLVMPRIDKYVPIYVHICYWICIDIPKLSRSSNSAHIHISTLLMSLKSHKHNPLFHQYNE